MSNERYIHLARVGERARERESISGEDVFCTRGSFVKVAVKENWQL